MEKERRKGVGERMGRQISFFMLKDDEMEMIDYAKTKGFKIFPMIVKELPVIPLDKLKEAEWTLYLSHLKKPIYKYIEKQKYYCIDSSSSEVIEISRSKINKEGHLCEGRLLVESAYVTKDILGTLSWVKKDSRFLKLYTSLSNYIKKNCTKYGSVYLSKRVEQWLSQGKKLQLSGGVAKVNLQDIKKWKKRIT